MTRIAIIGAGIAGLGCAHFLHPRFDITVFEQNSTPGGHSNTVDVETPQRTLPVDTGFMVYNHVTYPHLVRLFRELGVQEQPTDMSFSVRHAPDDIEWNGAGLNRIFGQRRNLLRPRFLNMVRNLDRFNREATEAARRGDFDGLTIGELVQARGYGEDFLNLYLVPMSSAIWSTAPERLLGFPARTLARFFYNHGFLGLHTHHQWYTVAGGSRTYVQKLIAPFRERIRLGAPVRQVRRQSEGVTVAYTQGGQDQEATFHRVILACHADEALAMLEAPDDDEARLLSPFVYQRNQAVLHTDTSVMPQRQRCWGSWNYRLEGQKGAKLQELQASTHYWMNNLQALPGDTQYLVSINGTIAPDRVIQTIDYTHPTFTLPAIAAQAELPTLNRPDRPVSFCGSYFKYGFHEDAFTSALELCRVLTGDDGLWR